MVGAGGAAALALVGPDSLSGGVDGDRIDVPRPDARNALDRTASAGAGNGMARVVWSVPAAGPVMALTLDDGPDPDFTPTALAALEAAGVRATFNVMGTNAQRHPDLLRRIVDAGHDVGHHTMDHRNPVFLTAEGIQDEIRRGRRAIEALTGRPLTFLRPPRGVITGQLLAAANTERLDVLMWSHMVSPPLGTPPGEIVAGARQGFADGAVVSMHDGIGRGSFHRDQAFARELARRRREELAVLGDILAAGTATGRRWVTVTELFTAGGLRT